MRDDTASATNCSRAPTYRQYPRVRVSVAVTHVPEPMEPKHAVQVCLLPAVQALQPSLSICFEVFVSPLMVALHTVVDVQRPLRTFSMQ